MHFSCTWDFSVLHPHVSLEKWVSLFPLLWSRQWKRREAERPARTPALMSQCGGLGSFWLALRIVSRLRGKINYPSQVSVAF